MSGSAHLEALPEGDWEQVYRDNLTPVYRFVFARTGNQHDAEDVTAQVFMRSLPRLRGGYSPEEARSYLITIARTVLADFWRKAYATHADSLQGDVVAEQQSVASTDSERRVEGILERLPEKQRRVLELRFLRGYSLRETADALGISLANAKVVQWRALRKAAGLDDGKGAEASP